MHVWSKFQEDIFEDFRSGKGATAIDATAGSGKSTVLVEGLKQLPPKCGDVLMTSFSTQSVEDLKRKEPPWFVEVRTMNSLGNRAIVAAFGRQTLNRERVYAILDKVLGERPEDPIKRSAFNGFRVRIKALVDMAKSHLVEDNDGLLELADSFDMDTTVPAWIAVELAQRFGVAQEDVLVESARLALEACKKIDGSIDFNDQIWLPYVHDITPEQKFNFLCLDEAQDTSLAQIDLLMRSCVAGARTVMAGQNAQAIYAWRGAGLGMDPLIARTQAKILPLSISYRCSRAVAKFAAEIVPGIQSAPGAIEGSVSTCAQDTLPSRLRIGDTVLSRKNAPLIQLFMVLLGAGVPVTMANRNLGDKLLNFIAKSGAKTSEELQAYTEAWAATEIERRVKKNPKARIGHIEDHVRCVHQLCDSGLDIGTVIRNTKKLLQAAEGGHVLLSTVHAAKGLEWDRVYLLHDSFPTSVSHWMRYAKGKNARRWAEDKAKQVLLEEAEERNIYFVAGTRSRRELILAEPTGYTS